MDIWDLPDISSGQYLQNQFDMIPSTYNLALNAFDVILSTAAVFDFKNLIKQ